MNAIIPPQKLQQLSVSERLRLIEEVWDSLEGSSQAVDLPEWHRTELDRRLESHCGEPAAARPWQVIKAELAAKFDK